MKKLVGLLIGMCLLFGSVAYAGKKEQPIPERFAAVMEVCGATNISEMHRNLIDYIRATFSDSYTVENMP
ncbi:MAG: hypothetical protein RSE23_14275, partial [Clostridia bacterium]